MIFGTLISKYQVFVIAIKIKNLITRYLTPRTHLTPKFFDFKTKVVQVISVCKSADMLMMVLDAGKPHSHREILTRELEAVGIRLNRSAPRINLVPKKTGGVHFNSVVPLTHLDDKLVYRVMQEYKMHNADILFQEDCTIDDLIDVLEVRT